MPAAHPSPQPTKDDIDSAPWLVITRTDAELDGKRVTTTDSLVGGDSAAYAALRRALATRPLRAPPGNVVVLQADPTIDVAAINVVVRATKESGRTVLFAVKNR